jgi:hypothetical protein
MNIPNEALRYSRCPKGHDCHSTCVMFDYKSELMGHCAKYERTVSPPNLRMYADDELDGSQVRGQTGRVRNCMGVYGSGH